MCVPKHKLPLNAALPLLILPFPLWKTIWSYKKFRQTKTFKNNNINLKIKLWRSYTYNLTILFMNCHNALQYGILRAWIKAVHQWRDCFSINIYSEQSRCSHFKSVCYYALSLSRRRNMFLGVQCTETCDSVVLPSFSNRIDVIPMGLQTPEW